MLKKTITYEDYSDPPKEVTRDFYFNFSKLEIIEMIEIDDLEGTMKRLQDTESGPEAYALFKRLILSAYGERNADGGFDKEDVDGRPLSRKFESLPACDELILSFLNDPSSGAAFVEGCLPAKLVKEAKAAKEANPTSSQIEALVNEANAKNTEVSSTVDETRDWDSYSRKELIELSPEEFEKLLPAKVTDYSREQLLIGFERKSREQNK